MGKDLGEIQSCPQSPCSSLHPWPGTLCQPLPSFGPRSRQGSQALPPSPPHESASARLVGASPCPELGEAEGAEGLQMGCQKSPCGLPGGRGHDREPREWWDLAIDRITEDRVRAGETMGGGGSCMRGQRMNKVTGLQVRVLQPGDREAGVGDVRGSYRAGPRGRQASPVSPGPAWPT